MYSPEMDRAEETRPVRVAAGIVGLFVVVGFGVGVAQHFALGLLIEQFVDPGTDPTDDTLVGIVIVMDVVSPFALGPLVAAGGGVVLGRAAPNAARAASLLAGIAAAVGFVLMASLTLFLTVAVLGQYGGGGEGPVDQAALFATVLEAAIPIAVVGGLSAFIGARIR